jgi:hypothetical protein
LERSVLYRYALRQKESFINQEIRTIMTEFGAETYSVPPEFEQRVNQHIEHYNGPDRPLMERALNEARGKLSVIRTMLEADKLPPDLAYMPLVESALAQNQASAAGAVGPWQLTPATARALGLRVDGGVDERLDLHKATQAGCRYLRNLILDFGAGSSVMLALAAYNLGPTRVKQAITKVEDPSSSEISGIFTGHGRCRLKRANMFPRCSPQSSLDAIRIGSDFWSASWRHECSPTPRIYSNSIPRDWVYRKVAIARS